MLPVYRSVAIAFRNEPLADFAEEENRRQMRDALGTRIWFRDPLHQVKFSDYNQRMRSHCLITEPYAHHWFEKRL